MTETLLLINIFIGKVDSAGKTGMSINDADLAVITVILYDIEQRAEWIKYPTLNAFFFQKTVVRQPKPS